MTDETYLELKRKLIADKEFSDFLRYAFKESLDTNVTLKVKIESNRKRCSICGAPLFLRASKKNGGYFWGCGNYPKCKVLEQATAVDIAEFAENFPDQFAVLQEQSNAYKEQMEQEKLAESEVSCSEEKPKKKKKTKTTTED